MAAGEIIPPAPALFFCAFIYELMAFSRRFAAPPANLQYSPSESFRTICSAAHQSFADGLQCSPSEFCGRSAVHPIRVLRTVCSTSHQSFPDNLQYSPSEFSRQFSVQPIRVFPDDLQYGLLWIFRQLHVNHETSGTLMEIRALRCGEAQPRLPGTDTGPVWPDSRGYSEWTA